MPDRHPRHRHGRPGSRRQAGPSRARGDGRHQGPGGDPGPRRAPPVYGIPPFSVWYEQHPDAKLGSFADAAAHGELVVNATAGETSLDALRQAGEANLAGKVLVDIANALDYSQGMPPSLFVANTDPLGERIQRAFPTVRVVKTLNTMNALLMVNPASSPTATIRCSCAATTTRPRRWSPGCSPRGSAGGT